MRFSPTRSFLTMCTLAIVVAVAGIPARAVLAREAEEAADQEAAAAAVVEFAQIVEGDALDPNPVEALYRPIVKVELSFAKRSCDLTDEQLQKAINECKTALTEFAKKQGNVNQRNGMVLFAGGLQQQSTPPREKLEQELQTKIVSTLTVEQSKAYQKELEQRVEFRRDAIVGALLRGLDSKLSLSERQSEDIREGMIENWSDNWAPELEMVDNYGQHYFPQIPSKAITPYLDASQKRVWNGLQKVNFSSGMAIHQQGNVIDDIDLGE